MAFLRLLLLAALLACPALPAQRVACLGDSITYGARLEDRERASFPARLALRLGAAAEVRNFGVGGATLLRAADRPFAGTTAFAAACAWRPDVAVVVLGTNDTCLDEKRRCWEHAAGLEADARFLAQALRDAAPGVRVVLCSPPGMFAARPGLSETRRQDLAARAPRLARVRDALRDVAAALPGVEFHDLARVLTAERTVDGVHPDPFGADALGERVAEVVRRPPAPALDLAAGLAAQGIAVSTGAWHGFVRLDFALPAADGDDATAPCILVAPHASAVSRPWVWRARFFGHQSALDLDLLDRGFHLAYCDVAQLYGAPRAVARWRRFHALAEQLELAAKPVLEGMSRGGLPVLEYAIAHPDRVAAVYGDNPVCDLRSWPGGRSGKRSDADWQRCLAAWGLAEPEVWDWQGGPLLRLAPLARAGVPVCVVLGTADEVVPPAENGLLLAQRYRAAGGPVTLWTKPGLGHHPHGLDPVAPLRRALLAACGFDSNPAVVALPSAEYRGHPAGWGGGSWWQQLEALRALADQHPEARLAFLGDSITQGLTGAGDRAARPGGDRPIDRALGQHGALSLGLSGDRTEHLLYRIEHGALARLDPAVVVLQIGANNIGAGHTAAETAAGIDAVLRALRQREPQALVVVCGPFPLGVGAADPRRQAVDAVHAHLAGREADDHVLYRDLRALFLDADGRANDRMAADHVHVTRSGQEAWLAALTPLLDELLRR